MEKELFKEKFRELLTINNPLDEITELLDKAVRSGAIYIVGEPDDSFRLCKITYYAILCELCEKWRPLDPQNRKEAKNLRLFL